MVSPGGEAMLFRVRKRMRGQGLYHFGTLMPDPLHLSETTRHAPYLQYQNLSQYQQLKHATFTRHGGTSSFPYASLNISDDVGDHRNNVAENLTIIQNTMGAERIFFTRQTHGIEILVLHSDATKTFENSWQADAMITNIPGLCLMIKQADCQAVILFDPRKNVVANVHCGWRGNVQNILGRVVRKMVRHFGSSAKHLVAAITPSLGPCCAEFTTYQDLFPSTFADFMVTENHFNLWRLSTHQLVTEGVNPDNITISGICTRCHMDRFFSYRGEGITGRFGTVVMLT